MIATSHSVKLKANGIINGRDVAGRSFICTSYDSATPFLVSVNKSDFIPWQMGLHFTMPNGELIKHIQFKNPEAVDRTIEFFVTDLDIRDSRLNVVGGGTLTKVPPTALKAGPEEIPAEDEIELEGAEDDNGRTRRKQIVITNLSESVPIEVQNEAGEPIAAIFPQSAWTIETDANLKLVNPDGAALPVRILEVFYTT